MIAAETIPLLRSWLFVGGPSANADLARDSGADVLILELEDFTPPQARPAARAAAPSLLAAWRASGTIAAVRVNPLDGDGADDLPAVMSGAPDIVMLPKVRDAADIVRLAEAVTREERRHGLPPGSTRLVPNIESAAALFETRAIAAADPRVVACLMASEDMTTDLGAPRTKEGGEIAFARAYFDAACIAARVLAIDYPYTYSDEEGVRASCAGAKALGMSAKSRVAPAHAALVNAAFTPSDGEGAAAQRIVATFEEARRGGHDRVRVDDHLVEMPTWRYAQALLQRAAALRSRAVTSRTA
jgi:citrate lyase beta subunit